VEPQYAVNYTVHILVRNGFPDLSVSWFSSALHACTGIADFSLSTVICFVAVACTFRYGLWLCWPGLFQPGEGEVKKPNFFMGASIEQDFQFPLSDSEGKDDVQQRGPIGGI
jgi:hypothetical protein